MILKNMKKENDVTFLYYELTFKVSWKQLIGIIDAIINFDFEKNVNEILVGEIAGSRGISKMKELQAANNDIYITEFAKEENGWISISGYSKTMEVNMKYTLWNQLDKCLIEVENDPYIEAEGEHVYDRYATSIEMSGFVSYARKDEKEKFALKEKSLKKETLKDNTVIEIECFACHTKFQFDESIPEDQKTFYCKCPNCGAEIKRGNPNYKKN